MVKRKGEELESSQSWDIESAERRSKVEAQRVIVSVAFSAPDFQRVSEAAARAQMRVSSFIRVAALGKVEKTTIISSPFVSSGNVGSFQPIFNPAVTHSLTSKPHRVLVEAGVTS